MPAKKWTPQKRGTMFEYTVKADLYQRRKAVYVIKAAASKGPFDMVAFFEGGVVELIQCKMTGLVTKPGLAEMIRIANLVEYDAFIASKFGSDVVYEPIDAIWVPV